MARKILLADDSVTAQNMGRKILVDAGYDVLTVNNGSAALKRITETKPDLIILDVYMPGYSGLEVCQRLKDSAETAHIPVLLSVGKLEPFKPQEARRVKANAHIVKPFEASELLSAIARLEDGMVPQAHKPNFCSPPASSEGFGEDTSPTWETKTDTGRKSGSRASRKKDSEADSVARFRDFRKVKGKSAGAGTPEVMDTAPQASVVADVPRDITTEELDALSAVAARLNGPALADKGEATQIAGSPAESAPVSESADSNLGRMGSEKPEEVIGPAVVASSVVAPAEVMRAAEPAEPAEMPVMAEVAAGSSGLTGNEIEIPVPQVEPASEAAPQQPPARPSPVGVVAVESQPAEAQPAELRTAESQAAEPQTLEQPPVDHQPAEIQATQEAIVADEVNTGLLAQEPAPVDQQDEPMFASAVTNENVETSTVEAEETRVHAETEAQKEEGKEEAQEGKSQAVDAKVEAEAPVPVAATVGETVEAEAPAPSDEELAEALRLLTPATAYAEAAVPSPGQRNEGYDALVHSRWTAEAVNLTPEEAAMSLEAEMFRTFASAPAAESESAPAAERVSAIAAAVDNRLAEVATQGEAVAEEAPKAMAAAATTEASGTAENSKAGSEEIAIASIVDKVLADLRPKIVEEIAKKLGKSQ